MLKKFLMPARAGPGLPMSLNLRHSRLSLSRRLMRAGFAAAVCASLGGCALFQTRWPQEGGGQFAEQYESEDERTRAIEARLEGLHAKGASVYAAGDFDEAKLLLVRIKRQVAADLVLDAEDDMDRMDVVLARMDARLRQAGRR